MSTQSSLSDLLHYVQSYIASGVHIGQNSIEEALAVLKGAVGGAAGKLGADEGELGVKGAYRTASRSVASATASMRNEL